MVTPLIPRADLFGNPERTAAQLSPDGKWLTFLAPKDGVLNIWIAPPHDLAAARAITDEKVRPIRGYFWSRASDLVCYVQDKDGDENFLLYATDPETGETRNLTPFENTRVSLVARSHAIPNEILIGLNNRDPRWHDVWRINLKTGERELVFENPGYSGFVADEDLNVRYVVQQQPDSGMKIEKVGDGGALADFMTIPGDDMLTSGIVGFDSTGETLYGLDSRGRDKPALVVLDQTTAVARVLAEDDKSGITGVIQDPVTGVVEGYGVNYLKNTWHALEPALAADIDLIDGQVTGEWAVASRTDDSKLWLIVIDPVTEPPYYALYDRGAKTLEKLFTTRPALEGAPLSPMHPIEIKSRDGLTLVSYLTLPHGSDANGDGKPDDGPLPLVLWVHGGPWARDGYGYNAVHQWLANRGCAVLSINFRGSTGFGKAFINAGDHQWGRTMHDDLIDAVDWAIAQGIADKDKIAISGASYGGYATLAGLTMTPEKFACGVDIVGPSNLQTLLDSIPPYWAGMFETLARRVGDPRTEEGKALLKERSPLTYVQNIERPLLIGQGANDPRVKQAESDQIVTAMNKHRIPVTYALYPDEGHGFARPENSISFFAVFEAFLAHYLGGRFEPIGKDFEGASLQVPEGARHVPGLDAALAG